MQRSSVQVFKVVLQVLCSSTAPAGTSWH